MYDEDYFLRGRESGKSLYEDYRWLPNLTIPMVQAMIKHLGIKKSHSILDFGAARGYTVKAFRELDYECYGIDTSEWAVENCDSEVIRYLTCTSRIPSIDWIIAKDVFEHIPKIGDIITNMMLYARVGIFAVVPLSILDGSLYVVRDYELDVTHIHRLTLASWVQMFLQPDWEVIASYRVRGIKDNYAQYALGNGFITARRI